MTREKGRKGEKGGSKVNAFGAGDLKGTVARRQLPELLTENLVVDDGIWLGNEKLLTVCALEGFCLVGKGAKSELNGRVFGLHRDQLFDESRDGRPDR